MKPKRKVAGKKKSNPASARRSNNSSPEPSSTSTIEQIEACQDLLNKTWHMNAVGPLYKFQSDPDALLQLSRNIRKQIVKNVKETPRIQIKHMKVSITPSPDLSIIPDSHSKGIEVNIYIGGGTTPNPRKLYEAYLLCVDPTMFEKLGIEAPHEDLTFLPLCVWRGYVSIANVVKQVLENNYDCAFSNVSFSSPNLEVLSVLWLGNTNLQGKKDCELIYKLPSDNKSIKVIRSSFSAPTWRAKWNKLGNSDQVSNSIPRAEVERFHKTLQSHLFASFHVHFESFLLSTVITPGLTAFTNGTFKMHDLDSVLLYLEFMHVQAIKTIGLID